MQHLFLIFFFLNQNIHIIHVTFLRSLKKIYIVRKSTKHMQHFYTLQIQKINVHGQDVLVNPQVLA